MMRDVSEQEEQCLRVCLNLGQFYLDNPRDSPSDLEYACMALVTSKRITVQHVAAAAIALAEANRRLWDSNEEDFDSHLGARLERSACRKALDASVKLYAEQQSTKPSKPIGPDKPMCSQHNYPLDEFGKCWCDRVPSMGTSGKPAGWQP